ncbi:MAG: 50S ribosomal protein L23 [Spirochaetales bacterium]|nr:50S ribosomal protein L23 [Spirochaetales bacterium]
MEYNSILIEPVLSEKSNILRESGQYVFKVDSRATKPMIMEAVAKLFNVHPVACRVINVTSKPKRLRGRPGRTSEWKKAIVRLQKGETIRVFEGA